MVLAILALTVSHLCGIGRPFEWGHDGFMGAHFMGSARGVLRGGLAFPVMAGLNEVPLRRQDAFLHHPLLANIEYTSVAAIFGSREWVGRGLSLFHTLLAAVLLFFLTLLLTKSEARAAAATITFALLPATHAFGSLIERDPLTIAYGLAATVALLLFFRAPADKRGRYATAVLATSVLAANSDWEAFYLLGLLCLTCTWLSWRQRSLLTLGVGVGIGVAAVSAVGLHFFIVQRAGLLQDLLNSFHFRTELALPASVYWSRMGRWFRIGFGWPGVVLTTLFCISLLVRTITRSLRTIDFAAASLLFAGLGHYLLFKQACWIHIFLIAHLSAGVALASASIIADTTAWLLQHGEVGRGLIGLLWIAILAVEAPATWDALTEARAHADTLDQEHYPSGYDERLRVADETRCLTLPGSRIAVLQGTDRIEWDWHLDRPYDVVNARMLPSSDRYAALVAEEREISAPLRAVLLADHPARRLGPWLIIDFATNNVGTTDLHFAEAALSPIDRFFRAPFSRLLDVRDARGNPASACGPP